MPPRKCYPANSKNTKTKNQQVNMYDPYYEYRTDPRTGKPKKYKKQIPSYIPPADATILASVRKRAYRLDMSLFNFLGIRFGWSSVIGLVPAIGDVVDGSLSLLTVRKCAKITGGLPQSVLIQMLIWVVLDFFIGLVPFVGDLLDAGVKANSKNVRILEEYLDGKYKPKEEVAREKREGEEARQRGMDWRPRAPATVYQDMDEDEGLPEYSSGTNTPNNGPRQSHAARVPGETRVEPMRQQQQPLKQQQSQAERPREERKTSKGWFSGGGGGSKRTGAHDVEMGGSRRDRV
ncbi:hypothetical protein EJ08DRAFT_653372 [Tothia fuscella]|uniref:PH domain-containing protein n=1 Tax=Tothia fuscella TaxID=1048955 RepID=A0A9P4TTQ1_9PEZI|nr:hypothetical protein EJ08DRAFT_653372 [Tothia fuscella]